MITRLSLIFTLLLLSGTANATIEKSIPASGAMDFTITRNGDVIGAHSVQFITTDAGLKVRTDIYLKIKFAFLTLYDYQHEATEIWRDGVLQSLETKTNDDGAPEFVSIRREGDRLTGKSSRGALDLPKTIGVTSYWNPGYVSFSKWLNTQDGDLIDMTITPSGSESITVNGAIYLAERFHLVASDGAEVDIWYADGELMKMRFKAFDDSILDYARQ